MQVLIILFWAEMVEKQWKTISEFHRLQLPEFRRKLYHLKVGTIYVQHDGAKSHTGKQNIDKLTNPGSHGAWSIQYVTQPAQSMDLNKLDLCFFYSLQRKADVLQSDAKFITDIISSVKRAFSQYDTDKLERVHACLFTVYRQILKNEGSNQYDTSYRELCV